MSVNVGEYSKVRKPQKSKCYLVQGTKSGVNRKNEAALKWRMSAKSDKKINKRCLTAIAQACLYPVAKISKVLETNDDGSRLVQLQCSKPSALKLHKWILQGRGDGVDALLVIVPQEVDEKEQTAIIPGDAVKWSDAKLQGSLVLACSSTIASTIPSTSEEEEEDLEEAVLQAGASFPKSRQKIVVPLPVFQSLQRNL